MDLVPIFCLCDDFFKGFVKELKREDIEQFCMKTNVDLFPNSRLTVPEIMTIVIAFHLSGYYDLKHFYYFVRAYWNNAFPNLVSYSRFVELLPSAAFFLFFLLNAIKGEVTGVTYIDASALAVCKNKRISGHKVFKTLAKRGKTTMGWFYGFKLHLAINDKGQILSFALSPGNIDDRQAVPSLLKGILGKVYGDKGYISKDLFEKMMAIGIKIITSIKSNMKPKIIPIEESDELQKRSLIESVFNVLKNSCRMEHSRHRSCKNFIVNLFASLCAYMMRYIIGMSGKHLFLETHQV